MIPWMELHLCRKLCRNLAMDYLAKMKRENTLPEDNSEVPTLLSLFLSCWQSSFQVCFPAASEIPEWFTCRMSFQSLPQPKGIYYGKGVEVYKFKVEIPGNFNLYGRAKEDWRSVFIRLIRLSEAGIGLTPSSNSFLVNFEFEYGIASVKYTGMGSCGVHVVIPEFDEYEGVSKPHGSSPMDFPLKNQFDSLDQKSPHCYGEMVRKNNLTNSKQSQLSSFVYLHLSHDYNDQDKLFFCNQDQDFLEKIPWLIVRTDNYFVPSLFLIPSFEQELNSLFPRKETVFHFLGRYLFHPTNVVWGLVTRYYQAYLANADERIGIQIRVFDTGTGPFQHVFDQILSCALKENLLPETNRQDLIVRPSGAPKSKAVLMTSLSSGYFEKLRDMYWEHLTVTGEVIGIYQPSHEEYQQTEKHTHNRKALAEMYLLSVTDVLITSSWSTFGYVAQSLGGLTPWILYKPENRTAPDPACKRAMSMEPCFHAPPFYDCKAKTGVDTGELVPHGSGMKVIVLEAVIEENVPAHIIAGDTLWLLIPRMTLMLEGPRHDA
ncbi:hypothetical protein ACLB2K_064374 [Fragaria x ananassa]